MVLFGAIDGPGDVIVVVRGPERDVTVWRKSRKSPASGSMPNQVTFANVPSFYAVAASRPLDEIVSPATAAFYRIGVANLKFVAEIRRRRRTASRLFTALDRSAARPAGLFLRPKSARSHFLGDRLFRTTIDFPANVPTGTYLVAGLPGARQRRRQRRRRRRWSSRKVGRRCGGIRFRHADQPALYGAIAVVTAVMAGWLASLPFRSA